jgi:hypothetical protein
MFYQYLKRAQKKLINALSGREYIQYLTELLHYDLSIHLARSHPNPFNKWGRKVFSQTDEDGLTFEIIRRIGLENGTFAEYGVGNGLENNILALVACGWHGFWVGGDDLAFTPPLGDEIVKFAYLKNWITLENIASLTRQGLNAISKSNIDVISLDLDGNDIFFVEELLKNNFLPRLFIVEYNAKFAPPIRFSIKYKQDFHWQGDDYFGASLMSFNDLFKKYGFFLVCCNSLSGCNAFFVSEKFKHLFTEIPEEISLVYSPPRYFPYQSSGHKCSLKTIERLFEN